MNSINFDQSEVDKFNELAHRWWDPQGEFKPLHDLNPLRFSFIQQFTQLEGKKVLDIGCGGGILTESLSAAGAEVVGIDMANKVLEVAKLHLLETGLDVDYRLISAAELARQESGQYDLITCMELLEHVPDPCGLVASCSELLKPGGQAFFSTINRNPKSYLFAILGAEYLLKLLPKGTHSYQKFIKPHELNQWLQKTELRLADIQGINYNPLNKQFRFSEDVSVNYLVATQKNAT